MNYGKDGQWRISHADAHASGIVAEYLVFEALLGRARDPRSPLFNAQILPNIYLPKEGDGRRPSKLWSQIDCLVLTRKAAFVLEVKRRKKHIAAYGQFDKIWSTNHPDLISSFTDNMIAASSHDGGVFDETSAIAQNAEHARAFDDVCRDYPYERIYEQVVYVGSKSFSADCTGFAENVNASYLRENDPAFTEVIEAECDALPALLPEARLAELGESIVETYGDLNHRREQLHIERLRNIS